jgi:hypothetical protein
MEPAHLSWSQVNTLWNCGQQYVYRYLQDLRLRPGFAMTRGKAIHQPIEANMRHKMETGLLLPVERVVQIASDVLDAACEQEHRLDGDYQGMTQEQAKGAVKDEVVDLSRLHATELAPEINPTAVEVKILVEPSEQLPVKWLGFLDLIDGKKVRDTKTKRKAPPRMMADQSGQLTAYHMLYEDGFGEKPEKLGLDVLWRTPTGKCKKDTLWTSRSPEDMQVFLNRANAALRMIQSEVFLPASQDSWICSEKFCGYTSMCPYFNPGRSRPSS